jgi:hypothetical protein
MKTTLVIVVLTFWAAANLLAGPETLVKQKAKNVRDQNNASQGVSSAPSSTPPPASPTAAKPTPPAKPNPVTKIKNDIAAWQHEKAVSAEARKTFNQDVLGAVRGSKSPTSSTIDRFTGKLATAAAGKTIGAAELSRLAQNINLAVNSAGLPDDRTEEIATQVQADLEKSGVSAADATGVADSLRLLMTELKQ